MSQYQCIIFRAKKIPVLKPIANDKLQGGSNMTGTDLCVNKPHCAAEFATLRE